MFCMILYRVYWYIIPWLLIIPYRVYRWSQTVLIDIPYRFYRPMDGQWLPLIWLDVTKGKCFLTTWYSFLLPFILLDGLPHVCVCVYSSNDGLVKTSLFQRYECVCVCVCVWMGLLPLFECYICMCHWPGMVGHQSYINRYYDDDDARWVMPRKGSKRPNEELTWIVGMRRIRWPLWGNRLMRCGGDLEGGQLDEMLDDEMLWPMMHDSLLEGFVEEVSFHLGNFR